MNFLKKGILKQISVAFAMRFSSKYMLEKLNEIEGGQTGQIKNVSALKEVAATSAGLKSLCT